MKTNLIQYNVTIAAQQFNLTVLNHAWLEREGLVKQEDLARDYIFTNGLVQFSTASFSLLLLPTQLQVHPSLDVANPRSVLDQTVGMVADRLPHTPFTAVGLNFVWNRSADDIEVQEWTRRLFYRPGNALFREFETSDARFGGYFSKDVLGCRLRVDITPAVTDKDGQQVHVLLFAFNFHLDLTTIGQHEKAGRIRGFIGHWDEAMGVSESIVAAVERELNDA